jgi:RHS repeat-associated protein
VLRKGELRYTWTSAPATTPAYQLPSYTFTGQYSYMDDPTTAAVTEGFGLMFYNARWYDPALGRFTQADSIIPQGQGVQAWDRYAYANNNPLRYTDPSGHKVTCDIDENCKQSQRLSHYTGIRFWKELIKDDFGIRMSDDTGKKWDVRNLMLAHSSLQNINNFLDGKLREIIGDKKVVFKLAEYQLDPKKCPQLNCTYSGWTGGTTVIFYTQGNAPIRQMNIYHEFGHLIDNLLGHAPRNALEGEGGDGNPSYVGANGYLNPDALVEAPYVTSDPNYARVEAIQASDNDAPEQWADIFANAVAGNIDLSKPTGPGVNMYNFITSVLP